MSVFARSIFLMGAFTGVASTAVASQFTFTDINDPMALCDCSSFTEPYGINDEGQIVGLYSSTSGDQGFVYSAGTFTTLTSPAGLLVLPYAINDAGQIVGIYGGGVNPSTGAFLDTGGTFTTINDPLGTDPLPGYGGINDAGEIAGSYLVSGPPFPAPPSSVSYGYVDNGGAISNFSDPSASQNFVFGYTTGTMVTGINDAGQIVGLLLLLLAKRPNRRQRICRDTNRSFAGARHNCNHVSSLSRAHGFCRAEAHDAMIGRAGVRLLPSDALALYHEKSPAGKKFWRARPGASPDDLPGNRGQISGTMQAKTPAPQPRINSFVIR